MSGMLQVPGGIGRNGQMQMPYSPMRDIVFACPEMLRSIVKAFNRGYWPKLVEMVASLKGSTVEEANDEICKCNDVYAKFITECCRTPEEKYDDVMRRVGWEELSQPARFAYMAMLGCVTSGLFFVGMRDNALAGDVPPPYAKDILAFFADEGRRLENGIQSRKEMAKEFRSTVINCQRAGLNFEDLERILRDIEIGIGSA